MTATSSTTAATLEIEEAPLTDESTPTLKDLDVIDGTELGALGDEEVEPGMRLRQPQAVHVS